MAAAPLRIQPGRLRMRGAAGASPAGGRGRCSSLPSAGLEPAPGQRPQLLPAL